MADLNDQEETLFEAARSLTDPGHRAAFLDAACVGNPELRSRLHALLQVQAEADVFFESNRAVVEARPLPPEATAAMPVTEKPGHRIGRYKILEQIGSGGCGIVYVAEQEEPVRRRVALKVIKLGMDTKSVIARFEAERQALALMDHPNIAKVLDAGATETGRPYFVMELVRGIKITDYCDQKNLATRERLDLFIQACHAIQHAHQKGIIHRDIKPSNILVTLHDGVPVPKVIDFGVAKATTQQRLTDKTVYTAFEQFIGTPAYMSPEQAEMSGLDVDTRTDVYALGVLLYELLIGRTPFDPNTLAEAGLDEMRRIIREQEPLRPSTRLHALTADELTTTAEHRHAEPPKLIHLLRGDLDWIVMKCLEKDRTRRYDTANALAQDIERHLDDEPVTARPPSAAYRAQKLIRRNKLAVTACMAVAAALILGMLASVWQAVRATRAERGQSRLRQDAVQAREGEAAQRRLAEEAKLKAERQHYSASIALAQNLVEQGQYDRAKQILGQPGLSSLRGWEWGWLERACHRDLMTFYSGGKELTGVAFSPTGRLLATGCFDGTARLWDLSTGRELHKLQGHTGIVVLVGFSPDGNRLVTPSWDGTTKVWDVATGQLRFTLRGHTDWVYSAAFSPDAKTIATGSRDRTVRLWNADDGAPLGTVGEYGDSVMCVVFSPDGRRLAYAGGSGLPAVRSAESTVRILELEGGKQQILTGHSETVPCVAFSPEGNRVATASWDGTARWADLRTDTELRPFVAAHGPGALFSVAFHPNGRWCAVAGGIVGSGNQTVDTGLHLIELESGRELRVYEGHSRVLRGVAFSPDGASIATTSFDGTAKIWPTTVPPEFLSLEGHDQAVWSIAASADGQFLATGSLDQTAKIWDLERGHLLLTLPVNFPVVSLAFSPDSRRLVTVAGDRSATVWGLDLGELARASAEGDEPRFISPATPTSPILVLSGHSDVVTCVAYGPRGRRIVTGSKDTTARIWDAESGHCLRTLEGHGGWVLSVAFSPDGERLATASTEPTARVWEVETGRLLSALPGHSNWVLQVAWSPDGKKLVSGDQSGTVYLWDAATGARVLPPFHGHSSGVSGLAFSPDGERLATAGGGTSLDQTYSRDFAINLWDVLTGANLLRLKAHDNVVRAVAFSPHGTRLITGSLDHTARVRRAFPWHPADYPGDSTVSLQERMEQYKAECWSQLLAHSAGAPSHSVVGEGPLQGRRLERQPLGEYNVPLVSTPKTRPSRAIPPRDPLAGSNQVDLSNVYNAALNETWQPTIGLSDLGQDLSDFSTGLRTLDGVLFDARGLIQLGRSDPVWCRFPQRVRIPVGHCFRALHALQGVTHREREGAVIGVYRLHYLDGSEEELEIRYGLDVRDWRESSDPKPVAAPSRVAWTALRDSPPSAAETVRLMRTPYPNPRPDAEVVFIDFISRMTESAPFVLALTLDDPR